MTSRYDDRPRGVTLDLLDFTSLVVEGTKDGLGEGEKARVGFAPYAMSERDGVIHVVCTEGVGWLVTDDKPLELEVWVDKPSSISVFPRWLLKLSPDEVRSCRTGESIDLADLVRTFGARLESNFWTWQRVLSAEKATR